MDNILILDNVPGGMDEDNDMTVGKADMDATMERLEKLADENKLERPYHFIILPKKIKINGSFPHYKYIMSRMLLVDKNNNAIRTGKLTWGRV